MGWTSTDLARNHLTLEEAKAQHVKEATQYSGQIVRIIMHEWHARTWYAIIGFYENEQSRKPHKVFLRTDQISATNGEFAYKDMSESMGPYLENKPSRAMARAVFQYIPKAEGYAKNFREWAGIPYLNDQQINFNFVEA